MSGSFSQHHSYRSFLGLTSLMQISTRDQDFIIDTLELRSELYILNEAFTDPAIVKVNKGNAYRTSVSVCLLVSRSFESGLWYLRSR